MANFAPTVLRWISGFWCFNTILFCGLMLIKPQIALSIFHTNIEDYQNLFHGGNKIDSPNQENEAEDGNALVSESNKPSGAHKKNERHLQRMIGYLGISRALYGIFAIISGDNNQIVSYCIVNIISDSFGAYQYWSSLNIIRKFQVYIHVIIIAVFNILQLIFVILSMKDYKLKSD